MIELMRALHFTWSAAWETFAGMNGNILLAEEAGQPWFNAHAVGYAKARGSRSVLSLAQNEAALRQRVSGKVRMVHRTYHPTMDFLPSSTIIIETIHDLWDFVALEERGPRAAMRRHIKRQALARADRIVCVSQSTRNYLGNLYPGLADRAVIIPHGTQRISSKPTRIERSRPYFLFVGKRDRYKNLSVVLSALESLGPDVELVCFGGSPFTRDEQAELGRRGLADRVIHVGGDDRHLAGYYESALALVYPSRHEGFGLPLLEAMSHGCPVIASPLTSLPEVGGSAALYADADEAEAWAAAMCSMLEDVSARAHLVAAGRSRAAEFSWAKSAQQHVELYESMA